MNYFLPSLSNLYPPVSLQVLEDRPFLGESFVLSANTQGFVAWALTTRTCGVFSEVGSFGTEYEDPRGAQRLLTSRVSADLFAESVQGQYQSLIGWTPPCCGNPATVDNRERVPFRQTARRFQRSAHHGRFHAQEFHLLPIAYLHLL